MRRLQLIFVVACYVSALLWSYAVIVSPAFAYGGYTLNWPSSVVVAWVVLLALLPALLLPIALVRPSGLILWWLYLTAYIPSMLVPALSLSMPADKLLPLQISLLLSMSFLCLTPSNKLLAMRQTAISPGMFWPLLVVIWLASLAFICMSGRANVLMNLASLFVGANEYTIRSSYLAERGRSLAYVVGQLGQALNPFLIAFGAVHRRRLSLMAGIIAQVVVFGLTGFKTVLFSTIFVLILIASLRRWRHSFGLALTSGLIAVILICAAADRASGNVFFSSLVTRRTLTAPGLLTGFYFEHFSQVSHAGVGFRFNGNGPVFGPPQEIGLVYFGSSDIDANANLWAEGFADFGIPGIAGFTLLVAFVIWIYDSIAARRNLELSVLLVAMPAIAFSNTAPTTVLITHGGLAVALLLYLAPSAAMAPLEWENETLPYDEPAHRVITAV